MGSAKAFIIVTLFSIALPASASVFDGGEFSADKISEKTEFGFYGPDLAPAVKTDKKEDRFAVVPVGKPFYVIGDDEKCYWSNFSNSNHEKILIVYYKSPVSNEHCVYQKQFNLTPVGYSISVKNGGICVPTFADLQGVQHNWALKETGSPVAFSHCVGDQSYGDNTDKDRNINLRAQAEREIPPEAAALTVKEVKEATARKPASVVVTAVKQPVKEATKEKEVKYDGKRYTIQLLSFSKLEQAKNAIEALKAKGVQAFEVEGIVDGTRRFRVCSGIFMTTREAKKVKADLAKKAESTDSFVQNLSEYRATASVEK